MKKGIIIICVIISIISGGIGFFIGINMNDNNLNKNEKEMIGTYRTNSWNGDKEAVLILNSDKTCILPTGSKGTWYIEGNNIYLEYGSTYSYADGNIETQTTKHKQEAIIVDKGIMISTHFFEKVK